MDSKNEEKKTSLPGIDVTPDVSLLPKLGKTGYRFSEALAEFIENSLGARIGDKVRISIRISADKTVVADNGAGMDVETLTKALRLAYSNGGKKGVFSEFGLGLKTAATALGKSFQIRTGRVGEKEWHIFIYDEAKWLAENSWKNKLVIEEIKLDPNAHGTEITITNPNYSYYPNLITNTKKQLAGRFTKYIEKKELQLLVNGDPVKPTPLDLMVVEGKTRTPIELQTKKGEIITGWYGFVAHRSIKGHYGFDLIKDNRIVKKYNKFGFNPHPEVALLVGELILDFVPITHNKKDFIEDSEEYQRALETFKSFLGDSGIKTKARNLKSTKDITAQEKKVVENFEYLSGVTKIDLIQQELPSTRSEASSRHVSTQEIESESHELGKEQRIVVLNKEHRYAFGFSKLNNPHQLAESTIFQGALKISINSQFPLFKITRDKFLYSVFVVSEELAKYIINLESLKTSEANLRNQILAELALHQLELKEIKTMEKRLHEKKEKLTFQ